MGVERKREEEVESENILIKVACNGEVDNRGDRGEDKPWGH